MWGYMLSCSGSRVTAASLEVGSPTWLRGLLALFRERARASVVPACVHFGRGSRGYSDDGVGMRESFDDKLCVLASQDGVVCNLPWGLLAGLRSKHIMGLGWDGRSDVWSVMGGSPRAL